MTTITDLLRQQFTSTGTGTGQQQWQSGTPADPDHQASFESQLNAPPDQPAAGTPNGTDDPQAPSTPPPLLSARTLTSTANTRASTLNPSDLLEQVTLPAGLTLQEPPPFVNDENILVVNCECSDAARLTQLLEYGVAAKLARELAELRQGPVVLSISGDPGMEVRAVPPHELPSSADLSVAMDRVDRLPGLSKRWEVPGYPSLIEYDCSDFYSFQELFSSDYGSDLAQLLADATQRDAEVRIRMDGQPTLVFTASPT